MNATKTASMVKRIALGLTVAGATLFALNGACSPTNLLQTLMGFFNGAAT